MHTLDDVSTVYFAECKETLMTQHFTLNIISDPVVRAVLTANGVSYLRRMTAANPCADTLSLSRFGDTIHMDHYNWMIAEFNNDTSVVQTLTQLLLTYDSTVQVAEPNYYIQLDGPRTPADPEWIGGKQKSLAMIGMDDAWNHIGDNAISNLSAIDVAVVDEGVDYWRCDLGGGAIPNGKVIGGWCYFAVPPDFPTPSMAAVYDLSIHGTQVASIIGALTNNAMCGTTGGGANGMAGIAGGFNGILGTPNLGTGVNLVAYSCGGEPGEGSPLLAANVASAILEAGASSLFSSYGNGVDIINMSAGYQGNSPNYSIAVRNAMSDSWQNGTTFVAAEEDVNADLNTTYPFDHEPASEVIAVTSSDHTKSRQDDVAWGFHTDLTAPGGELPSIGPPVDEIADALQFDGADGPTAASSDVDVFNYFGECSAAAPHVTGVAALLRSWLGVNSVPFAREDPEGMLKASASDLVSPANVDPDGTEYITGFDDHAGWGFLQADQLFEMLDPAGEDHYKLSHVEIPYGDLNIPDWPTDINYTNVVFYASTLNPNNMPSSWTYDVKVREITGTYSYTDLGFNTSLPLYVWGNSGVGRTFGGNRGMANLLPNWQEPWCEVTSGQLGNQGVNITVDGGHAPSYPNVGVPGIRHEYSTDVTVHTYQYQLYKHGSSVVYGYLPATSNLGLGYSIFGATAFPSSVKSSPNNGQFSVWPSIASTSFNVSLGNSETAFNFTLFDELGREVFEQNVQSGTTQFEVPVTNMPSGIYLGRVLSSSGLEETKIVVQH
jgi:hypothetical protein